MRNEEMVSVNFPLGFLTLCVPLDPPNFVISRRLLLSCFPDGCPGARVAPPKMAGGGRLGTSRGCLTSQGRFLAWRGLSRRCFGNEGGALMSIAPAISLPSAAERRTRRYERAIGGAPSPRATHVVWFSRAGAATMGSSYRSLRCPTPHAREGAPQCRMLHQ